VQMAPGLKWHPGNTPQGMHIGVYCPAFIPANFNGFADFLPNLHSLTSGPH
jgi:hypothetical protein